MKWLLFPARPWPVQGQAGKIFDFNFHFVYFIAASSAES
jgi:hypothetical protein